jgi:hypothetical protein
MFESKGKRKTKELLKHIEILGHDSSDRIVYGFRGHETEMTFINEVIRDAWDLIEHNEWGVALDMVLNNLYEIHFRLDDKAVVLAKDAITACEMNYEEWKWIEELRN